MDDELHRVTQEIAGRLSARGIHLSGKETPDEISNIEDAVEEFEEAVETHGGDLMMDEPPAQGYGQPDNPLFLLPERTSAMSAKDYVEALERAADHIRSRER